MNSRIFSVVFVLSLFSALFVLALPQLVFVAPATGASGLPINYTNLDNTSFNVDIKAIGNGAAYNCSVQINETSSTIDYEVWNASSETSLY